MDTQELQNPEKVSENWIKNLSIIVNKMNNTKSSMIGIKPKVATKLDTVKLDKSETYPEENVIPEDGLWLSNMVGSMKVTKDGLLTLSGLKIRID